MNVKEVKEATWINLDKALQEIERDVSALALVIGERNADESGELIGEILREAVEIYTRLGVLGAVDLLEASQK